MNELPSGQGTLIQVDGRDIALFNVNGTYCAMDAVCPHEEGPLHEREEDGDTIVCPWHGYDFSMKTGECSLDPELRVMTYIVKTKGNDILIEMV